MNSVKLYDKTMYNLNASDFAKTVNEIAKRSKRYALELPEMGIHGECTPKDVIKAVNNEMPGTYDEKTGKLTKKGMQELIDSLRTMFNLDSKKAAKQIKVKDVIKHTVESTERSSGLNIEV